MKHINSNDDTATAWTFEPDAERPEWVIDQQPREVVALIFKDEHGNDVTCLPGQVVVTKKDGISVWKAEVFETSFSQD